MKREQIVYAINGTDYLALLDIYKKYKINNKFDQYFAQQQNAAKGSMPYNMLLRKVKDICRKLEQIDGFENDNSGIAQEQPEITVKPLNIKSDKSKERVIIDSNPHVNRADLPDNLKQLYDDNGKLSQEMKTKHALMKAEKTAEKRKGYLEELTSMEDKINKNWELIDKWYADFKAGKKEDSPSAPDPLAEKKKLKLQNATLTDISIIPSLQSLLRLVKEQNI